jgi:pyruvate formate lyase activating enzyme
MKAVCDFCWRHCSLENGMSGFCNVRKNQDGNLVTTGYGDVVAMAIDPIEKKPLFHYMPGSRTFSFALFGCNFTCGFCQNYLISQREYRYHGQGSGYRHLECSQIVDLAVGYGCPSISYTYSEPIVWQDCLAETAALAHSAGLKNIMVTNGSFSPESLRRLLPLVDAFNIDVKGDEQFYRSVCNGALQPVLDSIGTIVEEKIHLEVTTMVIEGMHTGQMIGQLGKALAERGVQVWHLSRFFPRYKFSMRNPTSEAFLSEMIGQAVASGIPYVYGGNSIREDVTYCPSCHAVLMGSHPPLEPSGIAIEKGHCKNCNAAVYGLFP